MSPLTQMIQNQTLQSHFQPIISLKQGRVVGAEASIRASTSASPQLVPAPHLFEWAEREGQLLELDRLCRRKALQAFGYLKKSGDGLTLFVNLEASVLKLPLKRGRFLKAGCQSGPRPVDNF